jgi:hypothetical protein
MYKGTQAELVKELGCSRTAISKLVRAKDYRIIYINGGKRIDIDKSLKALIDSGFGKRSNPIKKQDGTKKIESKPAKTPTEAEENIQEYLDGKKPVTLGSPRSIISRYKEFQQAEKDRIRNEKDMKDLINFNKAADTVFNFLRPLRDDLLEIAKRVSSMAYMAGSKLEAEKIINQEIERVMLSKVGNDYKFDEDLKKKIIQILKM